MSGERVVCPDVHKAVDGCLIFSKVNPVGSKLILDIIIEMCGLKIGMSINFNTAYILKHADILCHLDLLDVYVQGLLPEILG